MIFQTLRNDARLSVWSGEFADRAEEHAYREANQPSTRTQMLVLALLVLVVGWPIIISDYIAAGHADYMNTITAIRSPIPILLISLYLFLGPQARYQAFDRSAFVFSVYMIAETFVFMYVLRDDFALVMSRVVLFILLLNILVHLPGRMRVVANLLTLPSAIAGLWLFPDLGAETKGSLTVITLATFLFGFSICTWLTRLRRREFARAAELEAANDDLLAAQEKLRAASDTKSIFVANVSHELRTPLNAIIGFSDILDRKMFGPLGHPKYEEYVGDIRHSGRHLLELINDLLDLNRIESGRQEMRPEWVALDTIAPDWILMVREMARTRGQTLLVPETLPQLEIHTDIRALHQIMINLLTNACKYAGDGTLIELQFHRWPDGSLRIGVRDNGVGMDPETMARILQPFETAINYTASGTEGWGLGLPLARNLALANAMIPRMKSEKGKGTLISVQLTPDRVRPLSETADDLVEQPRQAQA